MRRRLVVLSCAVLLPVAGAVLVPSVAAAATAPTVTGVTPYALPAGSGGSVTIHGSGFTSDATVTLDGQAIDGATVTSGSTITATLPGFNAPGGRELAVTTAAGTSASGAADVVQFRYAPYVTTIAPIAGPVAGGTTVTITGQDLDEATSVLFGGVASPKITQISPTEVAAVSPKTSASAVTVQVVTPFGTSPAPASYQTGDTFTYGGFSLVARSLVAPAGHRIRTARLAGTVCPAVGTCYVAGSYIDASTGTTRPLLDRVVGGVPTAIATGEPAALHAGRLIGVTCKSTARCYAIGQFETTTGGAWRTLLLGLDGSTWRTVPAAGGVAWDHLTCVTTIDCLASGQSIKPGGTSGSGAPQFLQIHDRTATLQHGATPKGATPADTGLRCWSTAQCYQWGTVTDAQHHRLAYLELRRGSTTSAWKAFTLPVVPQDTGYRFEAMQLGDVACDTATSCTAYGSYAHFDPNEGLDEWLPIETTVDAAPGPVRVTYLDDPVSGSSGAVPDALSPMTCIREDACNAVPGSATGAGFTADAYELSADTWHHLGDLSAPETVYALRNVTCDRTASCLYTGYENTNSTPPGPNTAMAELESGSSTFAAYELPQPAGTHSTAQATSAECADVQRYCSILVTSGTGTAASDYVVTASTGALAGAQPIAPKGPSGPAPSVSAVTPFQLSATTGGTVTVTGTNFDHVTGVSVLGSAATSFHVTSSTSLTATFAGLPYGIVDVRVATAAGGTSERVSGDSIAFRLAPAIASVTPYASPISGGTTVTIQGSGFDGVSGVDFGGVPATSFHVDSATQITAVAPAHHGGHFPLTVSATWGVSDPYSFYFGSDNPDVTVTTSDLALPTGVQPDDQFIYDLGCAGYGECYTSGQVQPRYGTSSNFFDQSSSGSWTPVTAGGSTPAIGPIACSGPGACTSVSGATQADLVHGAWTAHTLPLTRTWQGLQCPAAGQCEGFGTTSTDQWPDFVRLAAGTAVDQHGGSIAGGTPDAVAVGAQQLTCPNIATCVQWGTYTTSSGDDLAYAQTPVGSGWEIRTIPTPSPAERSVVHTVTCSSPGECVGWGAYSTDGTSWKQMRIMLSGGQLYSLDVTVDPGIAGALDGADFSSVSCSSKFECEAVATVPTASGGTEAVLARTDDGGGWSGVVTADQSDSVAYSAISCPQSGYCIIAGNTFTRDANQYPHPQAELTFDVNDNLTREQVGPAYTYADKIACAAGTRTCTVEGGRSTPTSYQAFHIDVTG